MKDSASTVPDADSASYLPLLDGKLALSEVPDLVAIDVTPETRSNDVVERLRAMNPSRNVRAREASVWRTTHVFEVTGLEDSLGRRPSRALAQDSSIDFAVPVFVTTGARADTLYLLE